MRDRKNDVDGVRRKTNCRHSISIESEKKRRPGVILFKNLLDLTLRRCLDHCGERFGIAHRQISEHFSIEANLRGFQVMDQTTVGGVVLPSGGVDARDPQSPQIALAGATISIRVPEALHHGFVGAAEKPVSCPVHALGQLEDFLVSAAVSGSTFYSCHGSHSHDLTCVMRTRWVHPTGE